MASTNRRAASTRAPRPGGRGAGTRKRRRIDYPRSGYHGLHRWLPSWRFVLGSFVAGVFLLLGVGVAAYALTDVPEPDEFVESQASTVYFADGTTPIGTFAEQRRVLVDYGSLPEYVGLAVVSSEDRTFFENQGIDPGGIARAFWNNIRGGARQGGSTLTQQYVERYYVGKSTKSYLDKAREAILAVKIAQQETKEEILGRYLNTIYFGRGAYGIEVAAKSYFGKSAAELTVSEAALLAGIIPSPNNWDPAVSPEKAEQRWARVLDIMVKDGYLTQADRDAQVFPPTIAYTRDDTYAGPNGYILKMVEDELTATGTITDETIRRGGLRIVTTIDPQAQAMAVKAVGDMTSGAMSDGAVPDPHLNVGLVSLSPTDGAIVAMYGGADFLANQISNVTRNAVQAGSTFKPFALIAGLQEGIPLTKTYSGKSPMTVDGWEKPVNNFGNSQYGTIDLVEATAQSVNTVYAQLNRDVGPDKTAEVAKNAGITTAVSSYPSNVLGSDGVRPLDMASAYATIAAQGVYHKPFIVREATYLSGGSVAYSGATGPVQRFDAGVMADTTYAMTQVVQKGSGADYVKPLGRPIAGKTGTSTDNKSAWFMGFTPDIVTAVALSQTGENGKDQAPITPWGKTKRGTALKEVTGASWPSRLWAAYMEEVFTLPAYAEVKEFPARANVGKATPTAPPTTEEPTAPETEEPAPPAEATVPSGLEGKLEADARAALVNAGLAVAVAHASSDTVPSGSVISVSPGGGAVVAPGSTVTITVSSGPANPPATNPPPNGAPTTGPTAGT